MMSLTQLRRHDAVLAALAAVLVLAPAGRPAEPPVSAPATVDTAARICPLDRGSAAAVLAGRVLTPGDAGVAAPAPTPGVRYVVFHAEFETAAARERFQPPKGVSVFHAFSRFADLFVTGDTAISAVLQIPGLRWFDIGGVAVAPPPPAATVDPERPRGERHRIVRGGLDGMTGKGVVVAVVDSGVDFRHPDFIRPDPDGKPVSRLLYFWDTLARPAAGSPGRPAPVRYPTGTPVGVMYTRDELTAELRANKRSIGPADTNGHGTSVAGIAAGGGWGTPDRRYAGVAPDADIIAVRVGTGPALENSFVLPAVAAWLDEVSGERPLVVNCSFGNQQMGHDGFGVVERHLAERLPADRKGRVVCLAAGNEGGEPIHARTKLDGEEVKTAFTFEAPNGGRFRVYLDGADPRAITVAAPSLPAGSVSGFLHPLSGAVVFQVNIPAGSEKGQVEIRAAKAIKVTADAYIQGAKARLTGPAVEPGAMIASPGDGGSVVTAGSYDFEDTFERPDGLYRIKVAQGERLGAMTIGDLSAYSCPGFVRGGTGVKPDVAAPGQYHTAAASGDAKLKVLDATGKYQMFNGTSAATPYLAGVVALLMEKKPGLTAAEVKALLKAHATSDAQTGKLPNAGWGYGKLDLAAVRRMIAAVK